MTHVENLRLKASECRREAGRLEELARMAAERAGCTRCRDRRAEEQALRVKVIETEGRAQALEKAAQERNARP